MTKSKIDFDEMKWCMLYTIPKRLVFYIASSLKQQSTGEHVDSRRQLIICKGSQG